MGRILDAVSDFFEANEWRASELQGPAEGLVTGYRGDNGNWTCMAVVIEEHDQLLFYSICPVTAPVEARATVGEYLHRANYGLHIGNLELDYNDGEIRFKTSIDVEGAELTVALVRNLVYLNCRMMDRYLPGVLGIIHGNMSATGAIAKVEGFG